MRPITPPITPASTPAPAPIHTTTHVQTHLPAHFPALSRLSSQPSRVKNRQIGTLFSLSIYLLRSLVLTLSLGVTCSLSAQANPVLELDGYKVWTDPDDASVVAQFTGSTLVTPPGVVQLMALSLGGDGAEKPLPVSQSFYNNPMDRRGIESVFSTAQGLRITSRIIPAASGNMVDIEYVLENPGDTVLQLGNEGANQVHTGQGLTNLEDPGGGYGGWLYAVLTPFVADDREALRVDEDSASQPLPLHPGQWLGWQNRYEVAAIRLTDDQFSAVVILDPRVQGSALPENLFLQLNNLPATLAPGQTVVLNVQGLLSQKDRQALAQPDITLDRLLLMNLWDWFRWLCFAIWALLDVIFAVCGDWGSSIILLALLVRILTIPVTRKSLKYQELALQQQTRMTPLIAGIKAQYSGIEQSQKLIELYETQQYDHLAPFKSMLGLFVQIPIFIALFNVLGDAHELRGAGFLWINDLAKSDRLFDLGINLPYFGRYFNLLPFLMAAITVLSTWLSGRYSGTAKTQSLTLFGMAGVFFVLFYSFPSALVLYWMFSNFFQLVQQSLEHHYNPAKQKR